MDGSLWTGVEMAAQASMNSFGFVVANTKCEDKRHPHSSRYLD